MAVDGENVRQVMAWLAPGGPVTSASPGAEALAQKLAAVVFQGDTQWPTHHEQADSYRDALSAWLGDDESMFAELTKPDADPGMFVDWFLPVVDRRAGQGAAQGQQPDPAAAAQDGGAATGLSNPNFDGTPGTEFYRFDEAAQDYQYSAVADGGDWATYEQRRYGEPARDDAYGLTYRYDQRDSVHEWYDEAGQTWQNQAWADQHAAGGQGAAGAQSAEPTAAGSSAGPVPEWDENWMMFYRVDASGTYQFADAVTPGDKASGCGDMWLSQEEAAARGAGRQGGSATAASEPHAAAADAVYQAMRAAVGSALTANPGLSDVLTEEHINAVLADVAREVIG